MTALGRHPARRLHRRGRGRSPRSSRPSRSSLAAGAAYRAARRGAPDGAADVYVDLTADPTSARSRPRRTTQMLALFAERGGDPDRAGKRDPLDPLLWRGAPGRASRRGTAARSARAARAGTSSARSSPATHLGVPFDVQGGGTDLLFPHHEMSAGARPALDRCGPSPGPTCHRHGRARRREDEQVARQPRPRLRAARARAWTRWPIRLAMLAHHYRTPGTGPTSACARRRSAWRLAGGGVGQRRPGRGRHARRRAGGARRRPRHPGRAGRDRRLGGPVRWPARRAPWRAPPASSAVRLRRPASASASSAPSTPAQRAAGSPPVRLSRRRR